MKTPNGFSPKTAWAAAVALAVACSSTVASENLPAPEDMPPSYKAVADYSIENTDMCLALKRANEKYTKQVADLIRENAALKKRIARLEAEAKNGGYAVNELPEDLKKMKNLPNEKLLEKGYYRIVNYWHNVRKAPSSKGDIAGVLKKGDIVRVDKVVVKHGGYYWARISWTDATAKAPAVVSGWLYITNANDPRMRAVLKKMARPL